MMARDSVGIMVVVVDYKKACVGFADVVVLSCKRLSRRRVMSPAMVLL
jgi:hypothetical protein